LVDDPVENRPGLEHPDIELVGVFQARCGSYQSRYSSQLTEELADHAGSRLLRGKESGLGPVDFGKEQGHDDGYHTCPECDPEDQVFPLREDQQQIEQVDLLFPPGFLLRQSVLLENREINLKL
jgi:hypothetical protein